MVPIPWQSLVQLARKARRLGRAELEVRWLTGHCWETSEQVDGVGR